MAETDVPNWLNSCFLETALRSGGYGPTVTVTSSEIGSATGAGDNYVCEIYRAKLQVTLEGRRSTVSLIVKALPAGGEMSTIISDSGAFEKESGALMTILPAVYRQLDEISPGKFQPFAPRCLYYHSGSPTPAIVMDDLKEQGFRMLDKTVGLDMKHCLLVMKNLAQSHAASAVLHLKDPKMFKPFDESFYCERQRKFMEVILQPNIQSLAKEVEKWPLYSDRFASKLHRLADKAVDFIIKDLERNDDDFNVFVHGDLWVNNIMFRYSDDTDEIVDVRFLDYQMCHFTNAAQDLQYFLHTSPSIDLADKHGVLVEEYHNTLHSTFTLLGHADLCPSLQQLHKQLDKLGRYAVLMACADLPNILSDPHNVPDFEKMMKDEHSIHLSEKYKDTIKIFLPLFEQQGWLVFETA